MQALHTNDNALLEIVLQVNDLTIINSTIQRLPSSFVLPFLTTVVEKFQTKPARGIALINWIRAVLVQHTSYLMTVPDLLRNLAPLYSTVDSRLASFKKLMKLSGRLDLIMSQRMQSTATAADSIATKPFAVYTEGAEDEEESTNESVEDDSAESSEEDADMAEALSAEEGNSDEI